MLARSFLAVWFVVLVACSNEDRAAPATSTPAAQQAGRLTFSLGAIWQANADGSEIAHVVRPPDASSSFTSPTFSPDGNRMAYIASNREVWVADTDTPADPDTRIDLYTDASEPPAASDWSMEPRAVHWSPDGEWLLVTRQRCCGSGSADIILVRPDGSEQQTIVDASRLPSFPEATWSEDQLSDPKAASIVVVGGSDGLTGVAYDLNGREIGPALPFRALRYGVAVHQNPGGEGVVTTSSLGNPEPFGPVEVIDITGASRIVGGGCGATWSPDGGSVAYYDGHGIVVQPIRGSPDEAIQIVPNSDLFIPDPDTLHEGACDGFAMVWRSGATPTLKRQSFPELGAAIEYPTDWTTDAAPMPYASCVPCTVFGPSQPDYPYGIQVWKGAHQLGCQLTCYVNIRALPQGPTYSIDANGHVAFRQEFERQRPLGLAQEDGDSASYREILTVVPLDPIDGQSHEAELPALFIEAFYRYGDGAAEAQTREAMANLLTSLEIPGKGDGTEANQP